MIELPDAWRDRCVIVRAESDESWLSDEERVVVAGLTRPHRRAEWMASRIAAKQLAIARGLCRDARSCRVDRPRIIIDGAVTEWFVSLSHSAPYAAAAIDRRPVGIDVQVVRDISERAAHLFLTDGETEAMERCTLAHRLIHFWSAKEAAWKREQGRVPTLKRVPLRLLQETGHGLLFEGVETMISDDAVVALTSLPLR